MIELKNVSFAYDDSDMPVLDSVSLTLDQGERVALCGTNGSGKSTLVSVLNGALLPRTGNVLVDGVPATNPAELARIVGVVHQDPLSQIVGSTVDEEVAFGPRCLRLPQDEVIARTQEALGMCGLEALSQTNVHELSGGQQQLLAVAGVLANRPRYLVLDEAMTHLDTAAASVLQAIINDQLAHGVGVLVITHDPAEAARADRVLYLEDGRLVDRAPAMGASNVHGCQQPALSAEQEAAEPALILSQVSVRYGDAYALRDFSLNVAPGELVLLCGPCGAGKSTAAQVMAGVLKPTSGTVTLNGAPVEPGTVGYASQRVEDQLFANTVFDDVAFGPRNLGALEEETQHIAHAALAKAGVPSELFDKPPLALSGGMRRRAALAGVLALQPCVYVLDEPTAGLDTAGRDALVAVMEELRAEGAALVVVTHEPAVWEGVASRRVDIEAPVQDAVAPRRASALSHIDARVKYAGLVLITIALFATHSALGMAIALAAMAALALSAHITPHDLGKALKPATFVLLVMMLGSSIVLDGTGDVQLVGAVGLRAAGALGALLAACRIVALVGFVAVVQATTSLPETASACVWFLRPLGIFGLPIDALSMATSIALRMIPETISEFHGISRAQSARGARFGTGTVVERLKRYAAVMVPLVVRLFARSDDLARAMRDRCYQGGLTRMEQGLGMHDLLAILGVLGISLATLLA